MHKDTLIQKHFPKAKRNLGGAAEDKRIDNPYVGCEFPDK